MRGGARGILISSDSPRLILQTACSYSISSGTEKADNAAAERLHWQHCIGSVCGCTHYV